MSRHSEPHLRHDPAGGARAVPARKPREKTRAAAAKLFVLDTNVLMHDPTSLFRFDEHDIFLPMQTLEELDNHKKGLSEVARNARQASRFLDDIVSRATAKIESRIPIARHDADTATGRLFLQTEVMNGRLPASLATGKADNQIPARWPSRWRSAIKDWSRTSCSINSTPIRKTRYNRWA